jgi:hypothetical protein
MRFMVLIGFALLTGLASAAAPAVAQEVTAEIRTWAGESWRLSQPSLEVFYTIVGGPEGLAAPQAAKPPTPPSPDMKTTGTIIGLSTPSGEELQPKQGHRQTRGMTVSRRGIETEIPLTRIRSLQFFRQPVEESPLPPYAAATHFRYSVLVVLLDGSRVEGDYVNLGTAVVRGMTADRRVDIPWQEIESIRFEPHEGVKSSEERGGTPAPAAELPSPAEPARTAIVPL